MPKPLFKTPEQKSEIISDVLSTSQRKQLSKRLTDMQIDRILRSPRSKEYIEAIKKLDAGGHVNNKQQLDQLIEAITKEFPELDIINEGGLIGIVDICCLGAPYEVHTLSIIGSIIYHYKRGETLPDGMERARSLAMRGGFSFIEVYQNCCRCVSADGSVSVVMI